MNRIINKWIVIFSFFLFALILYNPLYAQETKPTQTPAKIEVPQGNLPDVGINVTISPVFFNLSTNPGEKVSSQLKVRNDNNFTEYFRIDLAKFRPTQTVDGAQPVIQELSPGDEFANWIKFDTEEFTLGPDQTKTIKFTISPPKEAALGYYYSILINRIQEKEAGKRQTVIKGSAAASVLLDVRSPNARRELELVDFSTDRAFYEYFPISFKAVVKSKGNIHIVPVGDIFIDWGGKKEIVSIPFNPGRGNVLPQTQRNFTETWDDAFIVRVPKMENDKQVKDKKGNLVYTTHWDFTKANKLRIGRYTAHLLMIYDNGQRDIPVEASVSFWVVPWKLLLGALVIGYFAFLGFKDRVTSLFRKLFRRG